MYLIIVGLGGIGRNLVRVASGAGNNVVVVDLREDRAKDITSQYDVVAIVGDSTSRSTLEDAGASRADALIATTSDDAANLMTGLVARDFGIQQLVSVVNEEEHIPLFKNAEIGVIENPDLVVAEQLYTRVRRPNVKDFIQLAEGKAEIFEIVAEEDSKITGQTLADSSLPGEVLVVAVERNDELIIPRGATTIEPGDMVTIFTPNEQVKTVLSMFTGKR